MRAWGRRISPRGLPARTSVSVRARLGAPRRSRKFPYGSFQFFVVYHRGATARRAAAPTGLPSPGSRFRSKARAGISYPFASDKTILILHGLGNGAIAVGGLVDAQP